MGTKNPQPKSLKEYETWSDRRYKEGYAFEQKLAKATPNRQETVPQQEVKPLDLSAIAQQRAQEIQSQRYQPQATPQILLPTCEGCGAQFLDYNQAVEHEQQCLQQKQSRTINKPSVQNPRPVINIAENVKKLGDNFRQFVSKFNLNQQPKEKPRPYELSASGMKIVVHNYYCKLCNEWFDFQGQQKHLFTNRS